MKSAGNNEIDLLLRRLGGRSGGDSFDGNSGPEAGPHLDADELSAYAENALPQAARARYTEHVADCARCRKIVTQLAIAAGVALPAVEPVVGRSALARFFASLFSSAVLRYAIPSLTAVVILGIGLMIFRDQSHSRFVAENKQVSSPVASAPVSSTAVAPPPAAEFGKANSGLVATESAKSASRGASVQAEQTKAPTQTADKNEKAGDEVRREDAAANKELQAKDVSNNNAPGAMAGAAPKPAVANASEPEEKREVAKLKKDTETDQPVAANKDEEKQRKVDEKGRKVDDVSVAQTPAKTETAPAVGGRLLGLSRGRQAAPADKKAPENTEIRTVAGRRFRKQGSAWVDTAFESSNTPVNVARGSEQFRALVADEPAIRTISEQLDGEVIVVWKSRTYRIY